MSILEFNILFKLLTENVGYVILIRRLAEKNLKQSVDFWGILLPLQVIRMTGKVRMTGVLE